MATVTSEGTTREFGKLRGFFWPIRRHELKSFIPLLFVYALICFNYNILRVTKDSLIITAPGSGAEALPFIKLWAILPMAILVTFIFTVLLRRFRHDQVFYFMLGGFLLFFLVFTTVLYPLRDTIHPHKFADRLQAILPEGCAGFVALIRNWSYTLYYVMSELWSTAIMTVLFWGFANEIFAIKEAKRFYAILGLGANVATIWAGKIAEILSVNNLFFPFFYPEDRWGQSLSLITGLVLINGLITIIIFRWYNKRLVSNGDITEKIRKSHQDKKTKKKSFGFRSSLKHISQSKYLFHVALIVIAYNISINMIEIVWKYQLKQLCPNPNDYNAYMAKTLVWTGILSTFTGLFFCGGTIRKYGWTRSAMITPFIIFVTSIAFFVVFFLPKSAAAQVSLLLHTTPLTLTVLIGGIQNACIRSCKYTLFDTTKELAFIPLSSFEKVKGKAAIDGVGSRLGKSGGSFIHQTLLIYFKTIAFSVPYIAMVLMGVLFGYFTAIRALGKKFNKLAYPAENLPKKDPLPLESEREEALV